MGTDQPATCRYAANAATSPGHDGRTDSLCPTCTTSLRDTPAPAPPVAPSRLVTCPSSLVLQETAPGDMHCIRLDRGQGPLQAGHGGGLHGELLPSRTVFPHAG